MESHFTVWRKCTCVQLHAVIEVLYHGCCVFNCISLTFRLWFNHCISRSTGITRTPTCSSSTRRCSALPLGAHRTWPRRCLTTLSRTFTSTVAPSNLTASFALFLIPCVCLTFYHWLNQVNLRLGEVLSFFFHCLTSKQRSSCLSAHHLHLLLSKFRRYTVPSLKLSNDLSHVSPHTPMSPPHIVSCFTQ